ncbi:MAG: dephospho-CoA kinase [Chlorobiaceae bacterium]|nr:dephospho-CoA kinase [Chlorobiaceae bacterium]MBA4308817.1 dephospho-CoA kinase [Chlorobiaceae bacterium]
MIKVAITGNIGAGKTTFANLLIEKGFVVVNADKLAKDLMNSNVQLKKSLVKNFGDDIYKNSILDSKLLSQRVFFSEEKTKLLNRIVHPVVIKEIENIFSKNQNQKFIFVEAALIFEAKMEKMFDYVIVIAADEELRIKRGMENLKISEDEIRVRMKAQITQEEKITKGDFAFQNNGTIEELKIKAELFLSLVKVRDD